MWTRTGIPALRMLLLCLLVLTQSACATAVLGARDGQAAPGYEVMASGWKADYHQRRVYWLDNERVMFLGYPTERSGPTPPGGYDTDQRAIYIWNVSSNAIEKYADAYRIACYADGYIRFTTRARRVKFPDGMEGQTYEFRYGPMGAERTLPVISKRGTPKAAEPDLETVVCEDSDQLRPEHGRLDLSARQKSGSLTNRPVPWYPPGNAQVRSLPFGHLQVGSVAYAPFANSYLIYGNWVDASGVQYSAWPKGQAQTIWLFHPTEGRVEDLVVPYGVWNGGASNGYLFTRAGVIAWYHGGSPRDPLSPGDSGLYLLDATSGKRIFAGHTKAWSVSPEGCRIAFVYLPRDREVAPTLQLIDVCNKERS